MPKIVRMSADDTQSQRQPLMLPITGFKICPRMFFINNELDISESSPDRDHLVDPESQRDLVCCFRNLLRLISSRCDIDQSQHGVALFIFGDSLADVGTNSYTNTTSYFKANFYPYGETFFHYPTGRASDGRLIGDFIAEYAKLPLIPPYVRLQKHGFMGGANFASGGAGALVDTFEGLVVDLHTQLKQMEELEKNLRKELGIEKAKRIIAEGVYFISIGSNDYVTSVADKPTLFQSISMEDYVGMVIGNITTVLEGIYEVGGRKFAMIGIGPIGCVPGMRSSTRNGSCSGEANKLAKLHNTALTSMLTKLETQLQGFEYSYFDFYTSLLSERIQYPSRYGFKVVKTACCGSGPYRSISSCGGMRGVREYSLCGHPKKYVFFDSYHPSRRANQQFAQLMWNGSPSTTKPRYLEALFKSGNI